MRFGRKGRLDRRQEPDGPDDSGDLGPVEGEKAGPAEADGPFDESEVDLEDHAGIDLGSLVVVPDEAMEVRLEVDEESNEVAAVVLVGEDGALELRAFAASRGGGAWSELRPRIAAEIARMGGTATEQEGRFGTELLCLVPVQTPDGQPATQPSRVIGHEKSAWLLRATLMGAPALEEELSPRWEQTIRRVVVRRGREARPPGSPLPLQLPPEARRIE
jgi:hypothetical protein